MINSTYGRTQNADTQYIAIEKKNNTPSPPQQQQTIYDKGRSQEIYYTQGRGLKMAVLSPLQTQHEISFVKLVDKTDSRLNIECSQSILLANTQLFVLVIASDMIIIVPPFPCHYH